MLVLQRLLHEQIILNPGTPDEIVLAVCEFSPGRVKLGIVAPLSVEIQRAELTEAGPRQITRKVK